MTYPQELQTPRLELRRPKASDADAIFQRYARDAEVTRFLGWARHRTVQDTRAFLQFADTSWSASQGFPYLAFSRADGRLVGSTGVHYETPWRASVGWVLARDAWGQGLATEMARAMVDLAFADPALLRLYAYCHAEHAASARVMAKVDLAHEGVLRRFFVFPNLGPAPQDTLVAARVR